MGEFDIKYKPRTTIKAQALADFVVECTIPNQEVGGQEDNIAQDKEVDKGTKKRMIMRRNIGSSNLMEHQKQIQVEQVWCYKDPMGS